MNKLPKELIVLIIKGLPNMVGLLILAWVLYQLLQELLMRNKSLTDALLSCMAH